MHVRIHFIYAYRLGYMYIRTQHTKHAVLELAINTHACAVLALLLLNILCIISLASYVHCNKVVWCVVHAMC